MLSMKNRIRTTCFEEIIERLDILTSQNNKTFSNDAIIAFLGGFSGAFFAFIFGRFANYIGSL